MKLFRVFFAGLMMCTTSAAAEDGDSYLALKGGITSPFDLEYIRPYNNDNIVTKYDQGYSFSGALGKDYGLMRWEVEGSYQMADVDSHEVNGVDATGSEGTSTIAALMLNGYVDIPLDLGFRPYVGGGLGGAYLQYDGHKTAAQSLAGGDEFVFAYQGMAGLSYELTEDLNVNLEYRIFRTAGVELSINKEDTDYIAHSMMLGVEFLF